jgi:hypothetical protein
VIGGVRLPGKQCRGSGCKEGVNDAGSPYSLSGFDLVFPFPEEVLGKEAGRGYQGREDITTNDHKPKHKKVEPEPQGVVQRGVVAPQRAQREKRARVGEAEVEGQQGTSAGQRDCTKRHEILHEIC